MVGPAISASLQVLIQGIPGLTEELNPELPDAALAIAGLSHVETVAFRHRSGTARALVGPLINEIEVGDYTFLLPAGSFFQTNVRMLPVLYARLREIVREKPAERVADIYGGVGTLGLPMAGDVGELTLVELDPMAADAAQQTARRWGLSNVTVVAKHAERALRNLPLDLAIVDPPRSGLPASVIEALSGNGVPSIIYLSCAPASLARDVAAFGDAGYRLLSLDMFDFYPQTYHVECLAVLGR